MYILITDERRGTRYRILCDVCGADIDLDADCEYLTPPAGAVDREAGLAHRPCAGLQSRFTGHWSRVTKPRHVLAEIADHNRHPVITDFLRQLKADQKAPR